MYLIGVNANNATCEWVQKRVFTLEQINQGEVEHVIDYLIASEINLEKATYAQMKKNAEKWLGSQIKKGNHIKESKDDTEVVLDFKDGFKFVKLIGKNAFQREGFLMSHCVAGYYGKNDEIYSLRDKNNMPHATLSKASQQIKGKGNGSIHPKYIAYVVQFLEHLGLEVRDSEMQNLGYVNIEEIKDENAIFPKEYLFKEKYFYKENYDKIVDKNGGKYESITLWRVFGFFEFSANLKVKFLFNLEKCIKNFQTLIASNPTKKDSNEVAMTDYNEVAMTSSNEVAMTAYNEVAMTNSNKVECQENNLLVGRENNEIELGKNSIALMGKDSKVKGVKGAWISLIDYEKNGDIRNIISKKIDGKKLMENTWYMLKNKRFVEVKND